MNTLAAAATCIRASSIPVVVGLLVGACTAGVPIGHVVPTDVAVIQFGGSSKGVHKTQWT